MNEPRNVLIVRTDRIGDVVLSLPLARIIKDRHPACRVSYLLRGYTRDLALGHPSIDEVLVLRERNGRPDVDGNVALLRERAYDTAIAVYPTYRIARILRRAGIPERIGTGYRWYSLLFNRRAYQHRKEGTRHELDYNLHLLRYLGIENPDPAQVRFDLPVAPESRRRVERVLSEAGVGSARPLVIIHPGSGGSAVDLPLSRMRELTVRLSEEIDASVVVTGLASEAAACREVAGDGMPSLAGKLDLGDLVALIDRAEVLVANSTGPIHVAAGLGKFVVGFYSRSPACSPVRWGPYTDRKAVFTPTLDCTGCTRKQCKRLRCMESIEVGEAFGAVRGALEGARAGREA